jgi:uncharacterized protein (TIGR02594 family)
MKDLQMIYPWITEGYKYIGLKEIPGTRNNTTIQKWLVELKAWWTDDETPWCGTYVGHCMKTAGLSIPKYYMRAKAWGSEWGTELPVPTDGCVVVFEREGGGHVGFLVGQTTDNRIAVLGGNQGNSVNISKFEKDRVLGYFWPKDYPMPEALVVTTVDVNGGVSTNEA